LKRRQLASLESRPEAGPAWIGRRAAHVLGCAAHLEAIRAWFGNPATLALPEALALRPSLVAALAVLGVCASSCGGGSSNPGAATPMGAADPSYQVSGHVTGLIAGSSVTLVDNGTDPLVVTANGTFQFQAGLASGSTYSVTITAQPQGELCAIFNGAATIGAANVTSVAVVCNPATTGTQANIRQLVQYNAYPGDTSANWTVRLSNVQAGSSIYVVGTWPNFASSYPTMRVTDGTNNYTLLDRHDDDTLFGLGIQGRQSMGHWYAANVPAGSYTIDLSPIAQTYEDWVGLVAIEIAGVSASPLLGHTLNFQASVPPGSNSVGATVPAASMNAIFIAVTFDDIDATPPTVPRVGSGFTDAGTLWDFTGHGTPAARAEYALVSTAGPQTATFDPQEGGPQSPDYMTCAIVLY
jgi:hypothetical protein